MLRRLEDRTGGPHFTLSRAPFDGFAGDVFKLEGEQVHAARETADRFFITEISFRRGVGELRSGAVVFRSKNMHAISHAARRDGEHAAKLTAAHHADGRA